MYCFAYNDGNVGDIIETETLDEAMDMAETMWDHLSDNDKARYTNKQAGGMFLVSEMEDGCMGRTIRDYSEVE